jgi:hypothetical protein
VEAIWGVVDSALRWVSSQKEWIFSGIGLSVLAAPILAFRTLRTRRGEIGQAHKTGSAEDEMEQSIRQSSESVAAMGEGEPGEPLAKLLDHDAQLSKIRRLLKKPERRPLAADGRGIRRRRLARVPGRSPAVRPVRRTLPRHRCTSRW